MEAAPVIASRTLHLREGGNEHDVEVELKLPQLTDDGENYFCAVSFKGLSGTLPRGAYGVDGVQALSLALKLVAQTLYSHPDYLGGRLHWLDDPDDLGFQRS